ncbi:MAG: 23S rRNA (adenine(2503)-C(2))-methyltransferase RlmN [Chloroflexi bacterium]|nr:23S rRNA (adenine(2503)-C(2))-methyltransferase RlmN [Chloroflexota bacterium]
MPDPLALLELHPTDVARYLSDLGQPGYRARQILRWVYRGGAARFAEMTDLPLALRQQLDATVDLSRLVPLTRLRSQEGLTEKVLFRLPDGKTVEAVLMEYADEEGVARRTVCVSSQAGCAYGCTFCATGQQGYDRNLTAGEIVEQVLYFETAWRRREPAPASPDQRGVTNVVFMGMGEPLANYAAVWQAVEILHHPDALGMGARHITISTVGLVPQILRLAQEPLQVGLAISLHAPTDELRNTLMPVNHKYPLAPLLDACHTYVAATGRRVTFEYVLLEHVNDEAPHAQALADLLQGLLCHVNLIPVNPTPAADYRRPSRARMLAFQEVLTRRGVATTLRDTKGVDIQAGCGQLHTREARRRGLAPAVGARQPAGSALAPS